MAEWHYSKNGNQQGPVSYEAIYRGIQKSQLGADDLVWNESMADWQKVRDVPELASALTNKTPSRTAVPASGSPARVAASSVAGPAAPAVAPQPQGEAAQPLAYQQAHAGFRGVQLTERGQELLRQTRPWVRFLAILGFIGVGLTGLAGLVLLFLAVINLMGGRSGVGAVLLAILYLTFAAGNFFMAMHLNRYASHITGLLTTQREEALEEALAAQKAFWKLTGTMVIAVPVAYSLCLALILGLAAAISF